jgi:acyl-CoA synthetase (AMP-forming)/AMP-acid ligase II
VDDLVAQQVSLIEEPLADWELLEKTSAIRFAADESVTDQASLERVIRAGVADTVVLKPMFIGLLDAYELAKSALNAGLEVIVSHALDTAIGRAGAAHLAAALGLQQACGLVSALKDEPLTGLAIQAGEIVLADVAGLGVRFPTDSSRPPVAEAQDPYAVPHPVESNAQSRPSNAAVNYAGQLVDWRTLCNRTRRAASALSLLGIGPGDAADIISTNGGSLLRDIHAVSWTGAALSVASVSSTTVAITDASMALEPAVERFWPLDETRIRLTTSGTSGQPKVVELTTGQLVFSAFGSAIRLEHHRDDRWLCCLPLNHVGGLSVLYRTAFYGTTMVLHDGFKLDAVRAALDSGEVTQVSLVPTMLRRLLEDRGGRGFHPNLRVVLLGGAPADNDLLDLARAAAVPLSVTYGMTETASQAATSSPGLIRPAGQIGPALPFLRVSTQDRCLKVQGPAARGTFFTNDRGNASLGIVQVSGRVDDVILSGGELIDPLRVEKALRAHPDVTEAAVIGVPDHDWGQRVEAAVVSEQTTSENLREWCRERLERFEVPKQIHFVDGIPRGPLGKVSRARVRAALANIEEQGNGRARANA